MTGEDLYWRWRPLGGKYWSELSEAKRNRWDILAGHVRANVSASRDDGYREGHAAGHEEGYSEGYDNGWERGAEYGETA